MATTANSSNLQIDSLPALLTREEVATFQRRSVTSVDRDIKAGRLPSVHVGRRAIRIPASAIREMLEPAGVHESRSNRDADARHQAAMARLGGGK